MQDKIIEKISSFLLDKHKIRKIVVIWTSSVNKRQEKSTLNGIEPGNELAVSVYHCDELRRGAVDKNQIVLAHRKMKACWPLHYGDKAGCKANLTGLTIVTLEKL